MMDWNTRALARHGAGQIGEKLVTKSVDVGVVNVANLVAPIRGYVTVHVSAVVIDGRA